MFCDEKQNWSVNVYLSTLIFENLPSKHDFLILKFKAWTMELFGLITIWSNATFLHTKKSKFRSQYVKYNSVTCVPKWKINLNQLYLLDFLNSTQVNFNYLFYINFIIQLIDDYQLHKKIILLRGIDKKCLEKLSCTKKQVLKKVF